MLSKLCISSNKRHDNLGLTTPHNKSQEREAQTHIKKNKENMESIKKTSPSHKKIRTSERKIKIPGSVETSIRALGIKLLIATQSSCWWLK
jgi:hypothetical protein